jgi:phosphatidylinositol kinase/protein kinase (PI-3  family)
MLLVFNLSLFKLRTLGFLQLGILEWVSNTTPLKCIISEEMAHDDQFCAANSGAVETSSSGVREVELMQLDCYAQRLRWVKSHGYQDYHKMYKAAKKKDACALYAQITDTRTLPCDYIRRRFLALAQSAEAFLTLRSEFALTLAASSLFGYILGKHSMPPMLIKSLLMRSFFACIVCGFSALN